MLLLAAAASPGALLHSPHAAPHVDRRAALQLGSGLLAAASFAPAPTTASQYAGSAPATASERFEAIRVAAATASLSDKGSSSLFSGKVGKLEAITYKESFLFTRTGLCDANGSNENRYLSVRLWEPINGETAEDIVKTFEAKFANTEKKTEGFKIYYGSVVKDPKGNELALFANIFETANEAEMINEKAVEFAAGELKGKAELVDKVTGKTPKPASAYFC